MLRIALWTLLEIVLVEHLVAPVAHAVAVDLLELLLRRDTLHGPGTDAARRGADRRPGTRAAERCADRGARRGSDEAAYDRALAGLAGRVAGGAQGEGAAFLHVAARVLGA
jgi:hypothetical protein